jgi:hypothetical protein
MSNFIIRKAERRQAKLRLALTGVSGSGKTIGAIRLAQGMKTKFIIIDTERKSADLYSKLTDFDVLELDKPFTPEKYIEAIHACEDAGYETIIIDSLSHAWSGEGGVLDMQDKATKSSSSKNSYTAWKEVTPWQNKLIDAILQSPAHIIVTMRSKTHHDFVKDNDGKMKPIKIGLAPVQREGMDYEFTVVLDIDKDSHLYSASKDRTQLFDGRPDTISVATGARLIEWLNEGKSVEQIEMEEFETIKSKMLSATLEELRKEFSIAKNKYPTRAQEFLQIANERKLALENGGIH